jgi:hypothetical protein
MLQSIATAIVLTLCAAVAGVTFGQERLTAQGRGPSDSNQAGAFHQEFAPASKVSEPYQILFQPRQLKESQPKLLRGEGPSQAHSSKRIVCGLAMMTVDPKADPKMSQPLQLEANGKQPASAPEPRVRRIEPTVCRD